MTSAGHDWLFRWAVCMVIVWTLVYALATNPLPHSGVASSPENSVPPGHSTGGFEIVPATELNYGTSVPAAGFLWPASEIESPIACDRPAASPILAGAGIDFFAGTGAASGALEDNWDAERPIPSVSVRLSHGPLAGWDGVRRFPMSSPTSGILFCAGATDRTKGTDGTGGGYAARTSAENRATMPAPMFATVTAYSDHARRNAAGKRARPGTCAAPRWVPLGSVVRIPGYGRAVVEDRTARRFNGRWDIHLATRAACVRWGLRHLQVAFI
jgi:3D (Asp-Asp-Asp) domain-containing protein